MPKPPKIPPAALPPTTAQARGSLTPAQGFLPPTLLTSPSGTKRAITQRRTLLGGM
jgi:hypothetical protein